MEPTKEDLESPIFEAIWQTIKKWDICREPQGHGRNLYAGATGTDVKAILEAIISELNQRQQRLAAEIEKLPYFMHGEYKKEFFVIRKDKAIEIIKKNIN